MGDPARALDLWPMLETPSSAHIYCCGPQGLMDAVKDMSGHWTSGSVHFESFGVDARVEASNRPFQVRLASGPVFEVGVHESILEALRARGIRVSSSCESGTCGSCRVGLLEGQAEHRDMVLDESEHASQIMVCVSRAKTPELLLAL
jgi:phthalate 4,5-dioxygenase reductase component